MNKNGNLAIDASKRPQIMLLSGNSKRENFLGGIQNTTISRKKVKNVSSLQNGNQANHDFLEKMDKSDERYKCLSLWSLIIALRHVHPTAESECSSNIKGKFM